MKKSTLSFLIFEWYTYSMKSLIFLSFFLCVIPEPAFSQIERGNLKVSNKTLIRVIKEVNKPSSSSNVSESPEVSQYLLFKTDNFKRQMTPGAPVNVHIPLLWYSESF